MMKKNVTFYYDLNPFFEEWIFEHFFIDTNLHTDRSPSSFYHKKSYVKIKMNREIFKSFQESPCLEH